MKETEFINQNKKKWMRFEGLYASKTKDPEELSELYMDINDDLSYAQTFYKRRTVRVYLNQLGQKVYTGVHKQKGESFKRFLSVWRVSLPLEIYRSRKNLLLAFVLFCIYAIMGAINTHKDPRFLDEVTGSAGGYITYTDITQENIDNQDPLAIYKVEQRGETISASERFVRQMDMFIQITTNNLKVAFMTFFFGFFLTIGTHILLFSNAFMVGSFQYFFHTKGLLITSFLGIWIHGAFEISAIIIAAAAGFTAGNGLLFPGSYTRLQALQLSTKRGVKIMLSLVPFIIIAGFLESFVTANYQVLPSWSKWLLILLSFAIILFFYLFYPIYVARKHPHLVHQEEVENFKHKNRFEFNKIRTIAEQITDTFQLYRAIFSKFMRVIFALALPLMLLVVFLQNINHYFEQQREHWYDWAYQLQVMIGYNYSNVQDIVATIAWTFILTIIFSAVFWAIKTVDEPKFSWKSYFAYFRKRYLQLWLVNLFIFALFFSLPFYFLLLSIFVMPFFSMLAPSVGLGNESFAQRWTKGWKYGTQQYANGLTILLLLLAITALAVQPIAFFLSNHTEYGSEPMMPDLLDIVSNFVKRIAMIYTDDFVVWSNGFRQLVYLLAIIFMLPVAIIMISFGYYNEREKNELNGLKSAFKRFGKRSRVQETEADYD